MDTINNRWKKITDIIWRFTPNIVKVCFFGGGLVFILVLFLTVPQACHKSKGG